MSNAAAQLFSLLTTGADLNYYTQQLIVWSNKYEANAAKLKEQENYFTKWEKAYDRAQDSSVQFKNDCGYTKNKEQVYSDAMADAYAHAKVAQYDAEYYEELQDLDMEYDTMKTMYEAMVEEEKARKESEKSSTAQACQDTGLLQGG